MTKIEWLVTAYILMNAAYLIYRIRFDEKWVLGRKEHLQTECKTLRMNFEREMDASSHYRRELMIIGAAVREAGFEMKDEKLIKVNA